MFKWWKDLWKNPDVIKSPIITENDVSSELVNKSFQLLHQTTKNVSAVASEAAEVLQKRFSTLESNYNSILDNTDDVIIVKNKDLKWTLINKSAKNMLGVLQDDVIGKTNKEIGILYPYLATLMRKHDILDKKVLDENKSFRNEESFVINGNTFSIDVIRTPQCNVLKNQQELIYVGRDLSNIVLYSKRIQICFQALNLVDTPIAIVENNLNLFFCNTSFMQTLSIGPVEKIANRPITNFLKLDDISNALKSATINKIFTTNLGDLNKKLTIVPMCNINIPYYFIFKIDPMSSFSLKARIP